MLNANNCYFSRKVKCVILLKIKKINIIKYFETTIVGETLANVTFSLCVEMLNNFFSGGMKINRFKRLSRYVKQ